MIIVSLETNMADVLGMINICIPFLVLEPILNKLNVHYYYAGSTKQSTPENVATIRKKLENTLVPVRVILGRSVISVKDLIELAPGDVVPLGTGINDELEVLVGQSPKFLGRPGMHGNRTAVQVTGLINEEEEEDE